MPFAPTVANKFALPQPVNAVGPEGTSGATFTFADTAVLPLSHKFVLWYADTYTVVGEDKVGE